MNDFHQKNSYVSWKWGKGKAQGKIEEIFYKPISKTIKGSNIKRNGTKDNPAYLILQKNGNQVVKLHSELSKHVDLEEGGHKTEDDKHFVPTIKISKAAQEGLSLHKKFNKGGTEVGVKRAQQLINREYLKASDIKSMYSYFARHSIDKKSKDFYNKENPSKGFIAWLLWGGDEACNWISKIYETLK